MSAKISLDKAIIQLRDALEAGKCQSCGCLHSLIKTIAAACSANEQPRGLEETLCEARSRLRRVEYDCLGCEHCPAAIAINLLDVEGHVCSVETVQEQAGWPPLPGSYEVLRYQAPVAVCTLTDENLTGKLVLLAEGDVAVVGTLQTENLGIERVISNVLANPNIRFLLLCGADSQEGMGHFPGQSLLALADSGIDEKFRIIGARGKRPFLRNVSRDAVEHFRRTVEVVDLIGVADTGAILKTVRSCGSRNPGCVEAFAPKRDLVPIQGYLLDKAAADPRGYFVIYVDRRRQALSLEHYLNSGLLNAVIEGNSAAEVYIPAIDNGLVSRLDHAAYLGRELARAEEALRRGEPYVQDAKPELTHAVATSVCGCSLRCKEDEG